MFLAADDDGNGELDEQVQPQHSPRSTSPCTRPGTWEGVG